MILTDEEVAAITKLLPVWGSMVTKSQFGEATRADYDLIRGPGGKFFSPPYEELSREG